MATDHLPLMVRVLLKSLLFIVLVPCSVAGWIPFLLLRATHRAEPSLIGAVGWFALALGLAGLALALLSFLAFAVIGRGTPAPIDPPKELVREGPYRWTRNPMYVGITSILLAEALFFRSWALAAYAGGVASMFQAFVLLYEEPVLRRLFGASYEEYCREVPRWLGPCRGAPHRTPSPGTRPVSRSAPAALDPDDRPGKFPNPMNDSAHDTTRTLLAEETRQINEYVRAFGLALVTWFAMNGTINTIAISWFADRLGSGRSLSLASIVLIGTFFFAQSMLGVFALRPIRRYFQGAHGRLVEIVGLLESGGYPGPDDAPGGHISTAPRRNTVEPQAAPQVYAHVVLALILTMFSFAVIWLSLTVFGIMTAPGSPQLPAGA